MHRVYGVLSRVQCKTCPHLTARCNGDCTRVWYKCEMYGNTAGPGTDWRVGWQACGAFTIPEEEAKRKHLYGDVYRRTKGVRKPDAREEIEGQMMMEI